MNKLFAHNRISRQQMISAGLNSVFGILQRWQCSPEQIQHILQISKSAYYKYRQAPENAQLNDDQVERLSYIVNIHAALRTLFDNDENVYGFMRMKNHNAFFNGKAPIEVIEKGNFGALYETFKRIDAMRGGMW